MTTERVGIRRIGQVALTVQDVERARAFYRDVLELSHLFDAPPGMSFFECGGVRLLLGEASSDNGERHSSILYLDVADIQASHALLAGRNVKFDVAPHKVADLGDRELWLAFFRDSEDNVLALMSEVPRRTP